MSDKHIIVSGNLSDGFLFIGPFDNFDDAFFYEQAGHAPNSDVWISTLHAPEPENWKTVDHSPPETRGK